MYMCIFYLLFFSTIQKRIYLFYFCNVMNYYFISIIILRFLEATSTWHFTTLPHYEKFKWSDILRDVFILTQSREGLQVSSLWCHFFFFLVCWLEHITIDLTVRRFSDIFCSDNLLKIVIKDYDQKKIKI